MAERGATYLMPEVQPVVSVLIITYNHEPFISQAVESALMQQTGFPCEITIGDDCSTDATGRIVDRYAGEHPDTIRVVTSGTNVGPRRNLLRTLQACRGRFIARVDGDDYWTDPFKLQKQVDFMETHPDCSMCFHDVMQVRGQECVAHRIPGGCCQEGAPSYQSLLANNPIPSPTVMYRSGLVNRIPKWFLMMPMGDWPLHILHAEHGRIGYIAEPMAVHRIHTNGIWSGRTLAERLKGEIRAQTLMRQFFGSRHDAVLAQAIGDKCLKVAKEYEDAGDMRAALKWALACLSRSLCGRRPSKRKLLNSVGRTCRTSLHRFLSAGFPGVLDTYRFLRRSLGRSRL